eukprot:s3776_g7.t1
MPGGRRAGTRFGLTRLLRLLRAADLVRDLVEPENGDSMATPPLLILGIARSMMTPLCQHDYDEVAVFGGG